MDLLCGDDDGRRRSRLSQWRGSPFSTLKMNMGYSKGKSVNIGMEQWNEGL